MYFIILQYYGYNYMHTVIAGELVSLFICPQPEVDPIGVHGVAPPSVHPTGYKHPWGTSRGEGQLEVNLHSHIRPVIMGVCSGQPKMLSITVYFIAGS